MDHHYEVPPGDNRFLLAGDSHLLKLGSHYVRADPLIPVTGQLPQPIGKAYPVNQDWFDICDLQSSITVECIQLVCWSNPLTSSNL